MRNTKFLNDLKNNYAEFLFFLTIFFTSCLFMDTLVFRDGKFRLPRLFFLCYDYVEIKLVLSVVLPLIVTVFFYKKKKNLVYMADASAFIMTIFSVTFLLDYFTMQIMWRVEKSIVIFHLGYALITYFTVFITVSVIALKNKQGTKGYSVFCKTFFIGIASVLAICFLTIYFLNRNFGTDTEPVNLIPFQGEFKLIIENGFTLPMLVRDIGNIGFFSVMAMMIFELAEKHKTILGITIPILLSILMECFQYIAGCGDPDIDDVIANTLGTVAGIVFYKFIIEKIKHKEKEVC